MAGAVGVAVDDIDNVVVALDSRLRELILDLVYTLFELSDLRRRLRGNGRRLNDHRASAIRFVSLMP